ncbi:MAG: HupE/UreJ family protein [Pseudomonadota bacterium]|nr:HupE/UreJ family protein [Pseudomonadota bacterium]
MRLTDKAVVFLLLSLAASITAHGHDLGVAQASLTERTPGHYSLRVTATTALAPLFKPPQLPGRCRASGDPQGTRANNAIIYRFSCPQAPLMAADSLYLPWQREGTLLTVSWFGTDGGSTPEHSAFFLRTGAGIEVDLAALAAGSGSIAAAAQRYTLLGIEHILLGFDHLLFVLCLLLIVQGGWQLVKTITAFTLAHSITLALATLGLVQVPSPPVEASIALSIAFLAAEILRHRAGRDTGLTWRYPWMIAFAFGLLHGLGFAGALAELGLPQKEIPIALLFFNVGVEVGQLLFVGVILLLGYALHWIGQQRRDLLTRATAYGIGGMATFWFLQRSAQIFIV